MYRSYPRVAAGMIAASLSLASYSALGAVASVDEDVEERGAGDAGEQAADDALAERVATAQQRFAEAAEFLLEDPVAERFAKAEQRLAEAAEDLAAAWTARLREGKTDRAFLGVLIADQDERGVHVGGLSPDGGAERAGLLPEDVIVGINGESLRGEGQPLGRLQRVLKEVEPGTSVAVAVVRDGEELDFDVITAPAVSANWLDGLREHEWVDRTAHWPTLVVPSGHRRAGLKLVDIGEDLGDYFGVDAGVLVLDTPAESPLKPGDIVRRIAGAAVSSAEDAYQLLARLEAEAEGEVRRKNRNVTVTLAPAEEQSGAKPVRLRSVTVVPDEADDE